MIDMAGKQIIPAVVKYTTQCWLQSLSAVKDGLPGGGCQRSDGASS